jgi:deoxyribonuclease-4
VPKLSQGEISKFKKAWQESSVKQVVAHVPFLVNLASPNKEVQKKSIDRLITEVSRADKLGIPFLVLHPGSYGDSSKQDGIKRIIQALNIVLERVNNSSTKILLETMAGQGTTLGSCFEEIAYVLERIENPEKFGVCFDTAHVFIAGYDIRGYNGYERVMEKFDKIIGLDNIGVIHVNDSKTDLDSRNDRHACIGEGKLGLQVFHAILNDNRFSNTPKILEIPERNKKSKDSLELLRKLKAVHRPVPEFRQIPRQLTFWGV